MPPVGLSTLASDLAEALEDVNHTHLTGGLADLTALDAALTGLLGHFPEDDGNTDLADFNAGFSALALTHHQSSSKAPPAMRRARPPPNPLGRPPSLTRVKGLRAKPGSRRARRWENLAVLHEREPLTDDEMFALRTVDSPSLFRILFTNADALARWQDFMARPADEQAALLSAAVRAAAPPMLCSPKEHAAARAAAGLGVSPRDAFLRIDRDIRRLFKKCAVPRATLEAIEDAVVAFLETAPGMGDEHTLALASGFERMALHGVAQFHGLQSASADDAGTRVTTLRIAPRVQGRPGVRLVELLYDDSSIVL